jgi:Phage integrase family
VEPRKVTRGGGAKKAEPRLPSAPLPHQITPQQHDYTLTRAKYKPDTVKRYLEEVAPFVLWSRAGGWPLRTMHELDDTLCQYVHYLYQTGRGKHVAINLRCGVGLVLPVMNVQFHQTDRALAGWAKLKPAVSYPPISYELTVAVAVTMARNGAYDAGVGILVAFAGWLRIGELTRLVATDVMDMQTTQAAPQRTFLSIRQAKTGKNQSVELKDPHAIQLLRELRKERKGNDLLFGVNATQLRKLFRQSCAALGLGNTYTPHSLRHGGATRAFMEGMRVEDVMVHGRWAANKSARTYLQTSRSLLMAANAPPGAVALGEALSAHTTTAMHTARSTWEQAMQ